MAKSVEEQVLDKKTKEEIRKDLLEVINTQVKDELVATVAKDVREVFDKEEKDNIKREISDELVIEIKDEINKEQKKLNRKKGFKIFRLEVYILLLIAIVIYLMYKLYINGGLDYLKPYLKDDLVNVNTTTTTTKVIKDLNYYISNYGYLVDSVTITNLELLKGTYSVDKIDITDKLAMSYNVLSEDSIVKEGIIFTVSEEKIREAYKGLFGELESYKANNFSVNGISYAYQESTKNYIAIVTGVVYEPNNLKYEILNIEEVSGGIKITSRVALAKDGYLYNIFNLNEEVIEDTQDGFKSNLDKFSVVEYTYIYQKDGKYYLNNISKK